MDSANSVPGQRDNSDNRDASAGHNQSANDGLRTENVRAAESADDVCRRMSGTQPRNRQHRMLEYYYGRDHNCIAVTTAPILILPRNPYRSQLIMYIHEADTSNMGIRLAHTRDDVFAGHFVMGFTLHLPVQNEPYEVNKILSFPVHGPIVGEEWWGITTAGTCFCDFTGYLYSD